LIEGRVSRTAQFGAFVSLDPGIEALLHVSQITDPAPADATLIIHDGDLLLMRVISVESGSQRLGLSLKEVTQEEKDRWLNQKAENGEAVAEIAIAEPSAPEAVEEDIETAVEEDIETADTEESEAETTLA